MSDEEIIDFAQRFVGNRRISSRKALQKEDTGLYQVLEKRKLMYAVGLENRNSDHRNWVSMGDGELVIYSQKFVHEKGIKSRSWLMKEDCGLYQALRKRKLLDRLKFENGFRNWSLMSDDELVSYAQTFAEKKRIKSRNGLREGDYGLFSTLYRRKLLDQVKFSGEWRRWSRYTNQELIEYAQRLVGDKGVSSRKGLQKEDNGLYQALLGRKLLNELEFAADERRWRMYSDEELIEFAKRFVDERGIESRKGLKKEDFRLFCALSRRKLLNRLKLEKGQRNWASMSDGELVEHAEKFVEKKRIKSRHGLEKEDKGLYDVLWRRKLLDKVGFEKRKRKQRNWSLMSDDELVEHAQRFVEEKGIYHRKGLEKEDSGLYEVLRKRGLLDQVMGKSTESRSWASISDDELVEHAQRFVEEKGIYHRKGLEKEDGGLYRVLLKRSLLDLVFADVEKSQSERAIEQIIDFTARFGGRA